MTTNQTFKRTRCINPKCNRKFISQISPYKYFHIICITCRRKIYMRLGMPINGHRFERNYFGKKTTVKFVNGFPVSIA